ncbi:DNA cytosine methyltransferase, partial [Capnocytophaga canis]|uniref:DNA cytosine methyltransferase n=1 Tax=Capnocytophaga canis TaxID=1848903 RepID=UPI001BB30EF0
MKIIELFSGIGGFTKGFEQAGYEFSEHYFSEIDKHAIANYKYNFPNAKHIGSVTDISNGSFRGIDIITFGSPCQDFSLAGKRQGLKGQRSSLITEAIRLIADIRPNIFIWENVKGAFSSNAGRDFTAILQAFANIGGYNIEWQLLNTLWFLPQNRERI